MLFIWNSDFFQDLSISKWGVITKPDEKEYFAFYKKFSLVQLQEYFLKLENYANELEFVPGGIFKPKVLINREISTNNNDKLELLSSGELQFIFTIHTILYHIRNINSVYLSKKNEKILYENINIIFDEIELCFHPDFQRIFIKKLIKNIEYLDIQRIKNINIIFSTHSPFILSDIPSSNILKLIEGKPQPFKENEQTFGANIHDLLANDFFLSDTMGEFANSKVNEIIIFYYKVCKADINSIISLKEEFNLKKPIFEYIINNIGEKVTKEILTNHVEFLKQNLG
jgi:predicted ATP-binding protein involved in virulence